MRYQPVPIVLVCAAAVGAPGVVITQAFAADYMTAAEAQKAMFPDATSPASGACGKPSRATKRSATS
jgi:hypothetical protein